MEEDRQTAVKAKWRAFLGIPTPQSEIDRQTMIEKERQAYDQACYEYGDHNIRVQPNGQIVYKTNDQYWIQAKDGTWMTKRKRGR
jgi:hypothetical protein